MKKAGIADATPYTLRHSYATLMLAQGIHPKVVAEGMGHSTTDQTLNTYSHVLPTMQQDATDRLEGLLYGEAERA